MNELINIRHNKKVILNEIKNKTVDKTDGNSILEHLDNMENAIKKGNGNGNGNRKKKGMAGGGVIGKHMLGKFLKVSLTNYIIYKAIEKLNLYKITPQYVMKILISYIHDLRDFISKKYSSMITIEEFNQKFTEHYNNQILILNEKHHSLELPELSDDAVLEMYKNIENLTNNTRIAVLNRIATIYANQTITDKIMTIIRTFFESDQSKYMLAYLTNTYTTIKITFGLGVLAFSGATQILLKISKIMAFSYIQDITGNGQLQNRQNEDPIIVLPSSLIDSDVQIDVESS